MACLDEHETARAYGGDFPLSDPDGASSKPHDVDLWVSAMMLLRVAFITEFQQ
jgi:hypothetical protein